MLFQEKNPGIKYEYIIKKNKESGNEVIEPVYMWRHGAWTDCSATCGLGELSPGVEMKLSICWMDFFSVIILLSELRRLQVHVLPDSLTARSFLSSLLFHCFLF